MTTANALPGMSLEATVAAHGEAISNLKGAHQVEHEAIVRVENKVDGLKMTILGGVFAAATISASAVGALVLFILGKRG
jgi:hypothetical protein